MLKFNTLNYEAVSHVREFKSRTYKILQEMKNELIGQKLRASKHPHIALTGSTSGKYPVVIDNGRTIIYISDKSKESETREKFAMHERHPDSR